MIQLFFGSLESVNNWSIIVFRDTIKYNFYEVKYEDLANNPQAAIKKIFNFLKVELPLDFLEKLNTLKASSSFKQNKYKTGIYLSRHFDEYFSQKEKNMINALLFFI